MATTKTTRSGRNPSGGERAVPKNGKSFVRKLLGLIGWTCCVLLILYAAAQALARTSGFRALVADRLAERLGMPLTIGGSKLDWRLNVTLEEMATEPTPGTEEAPEASAQRVMIRWNWAREPGMGMIHSLTVEGGKVRLVQAQDGMWAPACLAPWADKVSRLGQLGMLNGMLNRVVSDDEAPASAVPDEDVLEKEDGPAGGLPGGLNLVIRESGVAWWSGGRQVAAIQGLNFLSRQVDFPGRRVRYYQVEADEASVAGGRRIEHISFEMLSTEGRNIVLGPKGTLHAAMTSALTEEADVLSPAVREEDAFSRQEAELLAHADSAIQRSRDPEPTSVPMRREPVAVQEAAPQVLAMPTEAPVLPTPTAQVRQTIRMEPVPTAVPRRILQQEIRPTPTLIPDPMEEAMETFAAARHLTNAPGARDAPEGLSDDESEALIRYIKDMLESGE